MRIVRWAGTTALVAVPLTVVVLWLVFQHKPGWYQPILLDAAGLKRARADATNETDRISRQMVEGRPFDIVLQEERVNAWLAALPQLWPQAGEVIPPEVTAAAVHFDPEGIRLGAHYAVGGWRMILGVGGTLRLSKDGRSLVAALHDLHAGSLPLSPAWLHWLVESPGTAPYLVTESSSPRGPGRSQRLRGEWIDALTRDVTIKNRFTWFNGRRPFRIEAVTFETGRLILRIAPQ